jgi:hypothetical protein
MFARLLLYAALCAGMLLAGLAPAKAAPVYNITFLSTSTTAYSSNHSGQLAGTPDFPSSIRHAALWNDQAVPTDLGALGDVSHANIIGNNGIVAGYTGRKPVDACTGPGNCRTGPLTPALKPAALILLLTGLLAIGAGRHGPQRQLIFS